MSKRQEIRARRRKERIRNRLFVIVLVAVGALLITFAIILPSLKPQEVGNVVQITPRAFTVPVDKNSLGDPNAPVRLDVWEDFQCSGCLAYTENIEPQVIQNYVETGKIFYTYHFSPGVETYSPGNNESSHSANAAMCAADQGRFWDYHDILFANWNGENQGAFADAHLVAFANALGLNMDDFNTCFEENRYADLIQQDFADGKAKGVTGTPSIFVNDVMVVNSQDTRYIPTYQDIATAIDTALAGQ